MYAIGIIFVNNFIEGCEAIEKDNQYNSFNRGSRGCLLR